MVKICIVGGGAAGIVTARLSVNEGHEVTVYEQGSDIGGTWCYTEEIGVHSAMYEVLKTNSPKEIMHFSDVKFPQELPSFMDRQHVFEYLKSYAKGLPILIEHTVISVKPINNKWEVVVSHNGELLVELFDVVFVCNGHFFHRNVPLDYSKFKGNFTHSQDYRKASSYTNRRVAVIGAATSGIDISMQAAEYADKVYLIGSKASFARLSEQAINLVQVPFRVKEINENSIVLSNGEVLDDIDDIIACTGYSYKFPFLSDELVSISDDGQMVYPLYEHLLHTNYPNSLFFIGLNSIVVKFTLFEQQAKYALSIVARRCQLPSREELQSWQPERLRILRENGLSTRHFHILENDEWAYFDRLADLGNFPRWEFYKVMKRIFAATYAEKDLDVYNYKNINFKMSADYSDYEIVK